MTIKYYPDLVQGSEEWLAARCGMLTASDMKLIVTPTLKVASNEKQRRHLFALLAQRITKYVPPHYVSDDMLRGTEEELDAKMAYAKHYEPVQDMGFITNDDFGFTLGFSPDGLVGDDGFIEAKSRRQDIMIEATIDTFLAGYMPDEDKFQVQTGLLVSSRRWCDYILYCGGLDMVTIRVYPDEVIINAILEAAEAFETRLKDKALDYKRALMDSNTRKIPTERKVIQEMWA